MYETGKPRSAFMLTKSELLEFENILLLPEKIKIFKSI